MSKEICKLLILGDEGVGKTTLLKRLEKGRFVPSVTRTSEAVFLCGHQSVPFVVAVRA